MESIAERITSAREALGITRYRLAKEAGFAPTYIYRWEGGKWQPDATRARSLARALGVSMEWLLFGDDGAAA